MRLKTRRQYSMEFKRHVVQYSLESPDTLSSVAEQFGLHPNVLCRWRRELVTADAHSPAGVPNHGPTKSLGELERENRKLKQRLERAELEVEILKKATEYFAKSPK